MRKKLHLFLTAVALATAVMAGCERPEPEPEPIVEPEPVDLENLKLSVPVQDNWIFTDEHPTITIHAENPNKVAVKAEAKVRIATDLKKEVTVFTREVEVPANGSLDIDMTVPEKLEPGFYKANCYVDKKIARLFGFGVNPAELVSAPDMQDDFNTFWENGKKQLADIELTANLIEIPKKSTAKCKVYLVEIPSVPDGLEGDPVIACSGLQDATCPPHTNTAPFNNLSVEDKEMYYYPELTHEIPRDWPSKYMKFFKDRIK